MEEPENIKEKYKESYLIFQNAFQHELERLQNADMKAWRFLAFLAYFTGLYGYIAQYTYTKIPSNSFEITLLALCILSSIFIVSAWFAAFSTLKVRKHPLLLLDETIWNLFHSDHAISTIYLAIAKTYSRIIQETSPIIENKISSLNAAYNLIICSIFSSSVFLVTLFIYKLSQIS